MKRSSLAKTLGAASAILFLNIGTAQAAPGPCFLIMPAPNGAPACSAPQATAPMARLEAPRTAPSQTPPCARPEGGDSPSACSLNSAELGDALGNMAAGGLRIAGSVLRALAGEASRMLQPEPDM